MGLGTAGEGRGVNVVVSRKVAEWVDMVSYVVFVLVFNMYRPEDGSECAGVRIKSWNGKGNDGSIRDTRDQEEHVISV